ncbi:MAG: cyclic nucleotide-binding domain-containing protein, partial [Proteobacteria bacterium]
MPTTIDFNEIPIFAFFGPDARRALAGAFRPQIKLKGERILTFGRPVPGIFIIVEGEVDVRLPSVAMPVAHLTRGQCFGEMSLLDTLTLDASADVVVASESVKLFFCSIDDFGEILKTVDESASAFYRGAALQLSSRLRLLNTRIDHELNLGETMLSQIVQESQVNEHLAKAKSEIEETGQHVVEKLITIMPLLDRIRKEHPSFKEARISFFI